MKIINQSKNTVLAEQAFLADTVFKRIIGLLGKPELKRQAALILKPCNSIHTFFMRFSIDVLFLDCKNRVIKAISCFKPYRVSSVYFKSRLVIELPAGTIQSTSTQEGDIIEGHPII